MNMYSHDSANISARERKNNPTLCDDHDDYNCDETLGVPMFAIWD